MRLLVLGGTLFLSRAVAEEAVRRGHEVTCACRGSRAVPVGVRHIALDRSTAAAADVLSDEYDAVVDVARHPSWVRSALEAVPGAHWVFVSTVSVYAGTTSVGAGPGALPLVTEIGEDVDLTENPEAYGGMKVACERAVLGRRPGATVVRPGLVVGPGDPSGRFTYWPVRLADPGPVLAPGPPETPVQVVDARDLAAWLVTCAEQGLPGVVDGVGPVHSWAELLDEVAVGVGADPELAWVDQARLVQLGVRPWVGPGSLPVWLPEGAGMLAHDPAPALAAGLRCRPVRDTAEDVLAWVRSDPAAPVSGVSRAEEQELLRRAAVRP
ncbi:MAG TPA: NAD-dependent epimerase/dehydratase family protein [Marmoricola sp.]|nr:NAD-dependent epimerase/dehydratase family protein [Marmoricola sp.]